MPAKDIFHHEVRRALEKDGWTITHDPVFIRSGGVPFLMDFGAEKMIAAEKNGEQIAVEIIGQAAIRDNQLKLLVYDPKEEVIVRWLL
ncbi:FdxN element excision controlling factor protein [Candidatus Vecturithrix granuli]|uniref:FdxN element excision controlling factor protein n=1 Tax=Vecturithrix granuli TaxID=1499967 RepID=A0A081C9I1_VECG1|nr:FdxN element excision controlling factor protein [Candidatus Vecturithrix granuli]